MCFPYERRIGELSDTLTSGKSVEEQIFRHFFLQHCADHLPLPVIPETIQTPIPAAITHLLETPSDSTPENLHFNQLGRDAEDFFNGKVSSRFSLLSAGDPFLIVEWGISPILVACCFASAQESKQACPVNIFKRPQGLLHTAVQRCIYFGRASH